MIFFYFNWLIGLEHYPFLYNRNGNNNTIIFHCNISNIEHIQLPKIILQNFCSDRLNNLCATIRTVKYVTLSILQVANEEAMNSFGILSCSLHNYKFLLQLDNSKHTWHLERSLRYNLLENLFKTYMTALKTSPQSEIGKSHLLIMVLNISLRVRLRLLATLFYSGLLIMVCWETMPQFSKYLAKWPLKLSI